MKYKSLNEAFLEQLAGVKTSGSFVNARGSKQLEKTFVNFTISDPTKIDITVKGRKFNRKYAIAEWLWYLSASCKVNNISKVASIWSQIKDSYGEVESNYGSYIFSPTLENQSQWNWVVDELVNDPDSRRATISINQPYHKDKNIKDYPCTKYIQFFIRKNKLHMGICMRSNDIIFGLCNDVFTFCLFQQLMLNHLRDNGLNIELGSYFHHAGSLHIYEKHFKMMDEILNNYVTGPDFKNCKNIILKPNLTYKKILSIGAALPSKDMSKKEIFDHAERFKGVLFDG